MNQLKQYQAKIKFIKFSFLGLGICLLLATFIIIMNSLNIMENKTESIAINDKKQKSALDCSLTVQNPVFNGLTHKSLPYTILANKMMKDKNNNYILESVFGECLTKNGNITVKALSGNLDETEKNINLQDDVIIIYNGASLKASHLNFNITKHDMSSNKPVLLEYSNSYIKADKMESEDYSEIIRLKGNVETFIDINNFSK